MSAESPLPRKKKTHLKAKTDRLALQLPQTPDLAVLNKTPEQIALELKLQEKERRARLHEIREVVKEFSGSVERHNSSHMPEIRQKSYLPRRFDVREMQVRKATVQQKILHNESYLHKIDTGLATLERESAQKVLQEVKSVSKFEQPAGAGKGGKFTGRVGPEREMALFHEIFVQPREQKLRDIKEEMGNIRDEDTKKQEQILRYYQEQEAKRFRILEEIKPDEALEKMRDITRKPDNYEAYNKSLLKKVTHKHASSRDPRVSESYAGEHLAKKSVIDTLSQSMLVETEEKKVLTQQDKTIFMQQIQVEPPDMPNAHSSSPIAPGLGWAPSIPFLVQDSKRVMLKDLLMRAKAGREKGEEQEAAHLHFYLALAYEEQKQFKKSILHFTDYYRCAQVLDDKIGMAFARNRIGVNYHKLNSHEKSLENHQANIALSDTENIFAGLYNAGISLRALGRPQEAMEYFHKALEWALSKQDLETECLVEGQVGLTHADLGDEQLAAEHLERCKETSRHIKNFRLNLDALVCLSRLRCRAQQPKPNSSALQQQQQQRPDPREATSLLKEALDYAHKLGDAKYARSCVASLGIMAGSESFEAYIQKNFMAGCGPLGAPGREINLRVSRDNTTTGPRAGDAGNK